MNKIQQILFSAIVIIGFVIRFWQLSSIPVSLNWDEISHGYNAYSLMQTGKDQWGISWPIFNFRAYGDFPTTLNMYLTIPFIKIFGLNALSIRLPSAICGFMSIIVAYFFGLVLFKNDRHKSLILMALFAISPWTFFPSRAVFQSTVALFFFFSGVTLILYGFKKHILVLPGLILFGLSSYAYHNARLVVPIFSIFLLISHFKEIKSLFAKHIIFSVFCLIIYLIVIVPVTYSLITPESQARGTWVSIINPGAISFIEEKFNSFNGNKLVGHLLYNKISYFIPVFIFNYLRFLNPIDIFFNGTNNYQFNVPNTGIIFYVLFPFFYIGLISVFFNLIKRNQSSILLFGWLIIGLIPATITTGDFPIIRATLVAPVYLAFITMGLSSTYEILGKNVRKYFFISILTLLIISTVSYLQKYFFDYSLKYAYTWQYGYSQAIGYAKDNYSKYDHIIISKKYGEPHEYVLFFWPWDPSNYFNNPTLKWDYHASWYWVDGFDKFVFVNDWEIKEVVNKIPGNNLLITSPGNYPNTGFVIQKTISYPSQQPVFDILTSVHEK